MALIEFEKQRACRACRSKVSIRKNGTIFFNKTKIDELFKNPKGVYLYVDDFDKKVAFKFTDSEDKSRKNFRKIFFERSGISIVLKPIFNYYKIELKKCYKNLSVILKDDLVILDLKQLKENAK